MFLAVGQQIRYGVFLFSVGPEITNTVQSLQK